MDNNIVSEIVEGLGKGLINVGSDFIKQLDVQDIVGFSNQACVSFKKLIDMITDRNIEGHKTLTIPRERLTEIHVAWLKKNGFALMAKDPKGLFTGIFAMLKKCLGIDCTCVKIRWAPPKAIRNQMNEVIGKFESSCTLSQAGDLLDDNEIVEVVEDDVNPFIESVEV